MKELYLELLYMKTFFSIILIETYKTVNLSENQIDQMDCWDTYVHMNFDQSWLVFKENRNNWS